MEKLIERKGTATDNGASDVKNHLKLESITPVKVGLRRAMISKQNSEVLSPLVLSPYEDIEHVDCPFVLEEPPCKEQQQCNIKTKAETNRKRSIRNVNLECSYQEMHVSTPNTCLIGAGKYWKSQNQLVSSSSTSKRTSQGSFLGAWEFSSSDELDTFNSSRNIQCLPCPPLERQHHDEISEGSVKRSFKVLEKSFEDSQKDLTVANFNGLQSSLPKICMPHVINDGISFAGESMMVNSLKDGGIVAEPSLPIQNCPMNGMQLTVVTDQPSRSLSQKYRPRFFDELVGQELVVQALSSAILKEKIAPVYLFHGPPGTGKTSTARILAAALNCCVMYTERRPCTFCSQCKALALGKSSGVREMDAADHSTANDVYELVQSMLAAPSNSCYKVFIIDECHMLTGETWNALLNFLEEPPGDFVFILVTTDLSSLPCTASSRCQKFFFMKVKHSDILKRLIRLVTLEGLDVEHGALDLIASQSGGSLRDAEMILDQLSLLGQTITSSAVLELVAPVSDEKLLCLLDLALSSDTIRTARKAKELVDSGVEPLDLITRLAKLITDILARSHKIVTEDSNRFFSRHMRSKGGLERLSAALRIIWEAEKQVKAANHDRLAQLTTALLQLGHNQQPRFLLSSSTSVTTSPVSQKGSGNVKPHERKVRHIRRWADTRINLNKMSLHSEHGNHANRFKAKARLGKPNLEARIHPTFNSFPEELNPGTSVDPSEAGSSPFSSKGSEKCSSFFGPGNLGNLWLNIVKGCKSLPLRHLLSHGKLLAVCFTTVEAMIHLEFKDPDQMSRAERYRKVIANTCKKGLGFSVNVKISLASQPQGEEHIGSPLPLLAQHYPEEHVGFASLEDRLLAKLDNGEGGSLLHWRDQSKRSGLEHDYPAFNMPLHQKSLNSLTVQLQNKVPAFGSGLDVSRPKAVLSQEMNEMTQAGIDDELTILNGGYWQDSSGVQEHRNNLRFSELVEADAVPKLNSADSQYVQGSPPRSVIPSYKHEKGLEADEKQESPRLEAQPKCNRLLCWRGPREEKPLKRCRRRKCRTFVTLIACTKTRG